MGNPPSSRILGRACASTGASMCNSLGYMLDSTTRSMLHVRPRAYPPVGQVRHNCQEESSVGCVSQKIISTLYAGYPQACWALAVSSDSEYE